MSNRRPDPRTSIRKAKTPALRAHLLRLYPDQGPQMDNEDSETERPSFKPRVVKGDKGNGTKHKGASRPFAPRDEGAISDETLALRFADRHAGHLRYVAKWGQWLSWAETHWRLDDTLNAFDLARHVAREAAETRTKPRIVSAIASAKTVAAIERLARSDRRIAATVDQWDADPWLLNTPTGVVDLRTGLLRPHRPDDYMTKIAAVGPGGDCPKFKAFLKRIMNSDDDLIAFLQRVFGYCLTGDASEQAVFFNYGMGQNGKGVLMSTVSGILGDYCVATPIETFTESKSDRHPTELARLRSVRLVTATETEAGRYWAESRLKELTGGERIPARFMHQNFFEYLPQFKPWISGNHRPRLRSVGFAMRRRVNMIPFLVTIPKDERDPHFGDKLREEWPGILQLMIDGCLDWQKHGLAAPEAVTKATDAYFAGEDSYANWIADCCDIIPGFVTPSTILFASWKAWAEKAGQAVGNNSQFREEVERFGVVHKHGKTGNYYRGPLRANDDETNAPLEFTLEG